MSVFLIESALVLAIFVGGDILHWENNTPVYLTALCAIIIFLLSLKNKKGALPIIPGFVLLAVYLALAVVSSAFSEAVFSSLTQLIFVGTCFGAFVVTAVSSHNRVDVSMALIWTTVVSSLALCLFGIIMYISHYYSSSPLSFLTSYQKPNRLAALLFDPTFLSGLLVMTLMLSLGLYLIARSRLIALLTGISFLVQLACLMLTGSKAGIISVAVGLSVFTAFCFYTRSFRIVSTSRTLVIAISALAVLFLFSSLVSHRFGAARPGGSEVHSANFRVFTWKATINIIKDRPLLGTGLGTFGVVFPRYCIAGRTMHAHQSYLQIASECGLPALCAFLLGIFSLLFQSYVDLRRNANHYLNPTFGSTEPEAQKNFLSHEQWQLIKCSISAALICSLCTNLVDSDMYAIGIALPFWVIAGILASQNISAEHSIAIRPATKNCLVALAVLAIYLTLSGWSANAIMIPEETPNTTSSRELFQRCRLATIICPLEPKYHRMLMGSYIQDEADADKEFRMVRFLAPTDSSTFESRADLAIKQGELNLAARLFEKAIECSPKSTHLFLKLSSVYMQLGNTIKSEATLRRLLNIENTAYDRLKGMPELVDVTFTCAHQYFGDKNFRQRKYELAEKDYRAAIDRLELWRSSAMGRQIARQSGAMTVQMEAQQLYSLKMLYMSLSKSCLHTGDKTGAEAASRLAHNIPIYNKDGASIGTIYTFGQQ